MKMYNFAQNIGLLSLIGIVLKNYDLINYELTEMYVTGLNKNV